MEMRRLPLGLMLKQAKTNNNEGKTPNELDSNWPAEAPLEIEWPEAHLACKNHAIKAGLFNTRDP